MVPATWFICDPSTVEAGAAFNYLSVPWACAILGVIIIIYTMAGGLWAVLLTDTLQFFVLMLTVIVVVPLSLNHIGGFGTFLDKMPDGFLNITAGDFTFVFLFGWMLMQAFQLGSEWQFLQRYFCVPTRKDARKAMYLFGALYLVSPFFFMVPPMFYRVITGVADPERAYILMCREVLPAGMLGMMIAALFSATASMISSVLNVYAAVLTDDVYKKSIRPRATERETVVAGRIITILVGIYMVAGSIVIPSLTTYQNWIIVFGSLVSPALYLPTIWALFSRKIRQNAVWWCIIATMCVGTLLKFGLHSEGWFAGVALLEPLIRLVESNSRVADLIAGNLATFVILLILEFSAKTEAPGWKRLMEAADQIAARDAKSSSMRNVRPRSSSGASASWPHSCC